ncbi:MAG: universal stress protein [Pseudomonadota bacterium]
MIEKKKVLLAVDGSEQSFCAVRHAANALSPEKTQITLMHVLARVPEALMDLDNAPSADIFEGSLREWQQQGLADMKAFMDRAVARLVRDGFTQQGARVLMPLRRVGYARDILDESQKGYAALIVGRHGFGCFNKAMLGSVTAKLAEAATHIPLAIVGGRPETGKCLVAVDPSDSSRRCVSLISSLFDVRRMEISLCHIVRPLNLPAPALPTFFKKSHEDAWLDANTRKIMPFMVEGKRELIEAGLPEEKYFSAILKEKSSRAESLFDSALRSHMDTIVAARRGVSRVERFSMGRVCRKLIQMAAEKAVWIV